MDGTAQRHAELRDRGLIDHKSTPAQIAAVEHTLAARMRARIYLEGSAPKRHPLAMPKTIGWGFAIFFLLCSRVPDYSAHDKRVMAFAVIGVGIACWLWARVLRQRENRREEALAAVDVDNGACTRCGDAAGQHSIDGDEEHPLVFHAVEVEREIGKI